MLGGSYPPPGDANLPAPDLIASEIADDLRNALEQIEGILGDLKRPGAK